MKADAFEPLTDVLPEPVLIVSGDGLVLAANSPAGEVLAEPGDGLVGRSLYDLLQTPRETVKSYLRNCSSSRQMVLGALEFRANGTEPVSFRCEGAMVRPRTEESRASILLRLKPRETASSRFTLLNRKIDELAREINERRRTERALRESESHFRSLSACSPVGIFMTDPEGRCTYTNPVCQKICGFTLEESLGEGWANFIFPQERERVFAGWLKHARAGREYSEEFRFRNPDGHVRWAHVRSAPLFADDGTLVGHVGTVEDITERRRAEALVRGQNRVLELLTRGVPLAEVLEELTLSIERQSSEGVIASILLLDDDGLHLRHGSAPSLPADYNSAIDGLRIGEAVGSCGTAAFRKEPVVVSDISLDPLWRDFRELALSHDLHACWSTPIFSTDERVLGTFALYYREPRSPAESDWELISLVAHTAAIAIERARAAESLRASEKFSRAILDSLSASVAVLDGEGEIVSVNRQWERFSIENGNPRLSGVGVGVNYLEVVGRSAERNCEEAKPVLEGIRAVLDGELAEFSIEYPCHSPIERRWFLMYASPLSTPHRGAVISHINISDRKLAEESLIERDRALEHQSRVTRTITDNATAALFMMDAEGRCTYMNPAAERMTGFKFEEVEGRVLHDMIHHKRPDGTHYPMSECPIDRALPEKMHVSAHEDVFIRSDGTLFPVMCSASPIAEDGLAASTVIEVRDITEEKRAQDEREHLLSLEREARREAEEASRLKDEFLATLSHELRTPLTAILGWAHMLGHGKPDEAAFKHALGVIERNARAQAQLVEDLLDVSRVITGKLKLEVQGIEPATFVESAIESARPAAEAKGIELHKSFNGTAGWVSGDPARLQQVVWNLLSNALKFTPPGGSIQVGLKQSNSHIEITVSDTGQGIPEEFLPHVFDRFRQADGTITRRHGGLGLGLSIARHLVELHGGTIHADSPGEGRGATFTINLPLIPAYRESFDSRRERDEKRAVETLETFECPKRFVGLRVVVVDDEPDTREMLKAALARCGANVVTAGSTGEALATLDAFIPDVLISDIGMPGEDGYELIRRVRALAPERGGRVPAIALTAYARVEDRLHALREGYHMHVPKPVELAELITVMDSLLERAE